jgi:Peptidase family M48
MLRPCTTMRAAFCMLACAVSSLLSAAENFHSSPADGMEYYARTHGRVDPVRLPRVYGVFDSVLRVADKNSTVAPELVVVDDRKQANAFVLADGSIVISRRALDIISDRVDPVIADARLAFVLGHELAHLADNDFWDHQISHALLSGTLSRQLNTAVSADTGQQKKELKADDLGFLYASLAGFRVESLLQASADNEDFLTFWMDQIGAQEDASYPTPAARTELLRARLDERLRSVQAFNFGVRLVHFGRYREALELLREFQQQFPSREVFNDIGYAYLQRALNQLPAELAYHYWLPVQSDLYTPLTQSVTRAATPLQPRNEWKMSAAAREDLFDAVRYFELAGSRDPRYAPAQLNLATTQLLLALDATPGVANASAEHLLRAELAAASARALTRSDQRARVLYAIVRFERARTNAPDNAAPADQITFESDDPAINYDLARMRADTPLAAQPYWARVTAQFDTLPMRIQQLLCAERDTLSPVARSDEMSCARPPAQRANTLPWSLPVQLSRDLLEVPLTEAERNRVGERQIQLSRSKVFVGDQAALLAIDDITTMVVLRDVAGSADSLVQCCSQPRDRIPVTAGELWRYDRWIAWIRDGKIYEIWIAN